MIKLGKKSIVWKWVSSYVCIIIVLAISIFVTYFRSQAIITDRQKQINEVILEQVSGKIHDLSMMIENLREEVIINTYYTALSISGYSNYTSQTYKHYKLYSDLNTYRKMNNSYSHLMLYFEGDDKVIADNSINASKTYWDIYRDETLGLDMRQWNDLIHGTYDSLYSFYVPTEGMERTIYARTIQTKQEGRQKINLFVIYTKEDLEKIFGQYQQDRAILVLDHSKKNFISFDSDPVAISPEEEQLLLEAISLQKDAVTLKQNDLVHLDYATGNAAEMLCIVTPERVYLESVEQFQLIFFIIFIVTIIFSVVLIGMFIQNNYRPVKDLLKTLPTSEMNPGLEEKKDSLFKNENEFAIVRKGMNQVKDKFQTVNEALNRQNKLLQKVYLSKLLKGGTRLLSEKEQKEIYDVCFKYHHFVVVLFYVEDFSGIGSEDLSESAQSQETEIIDLDHAQFVLLDTFREFITNIGWIENHTKMDDILALVISFPPEGNNEHALHEMIRNARTRVSNAYNIVFSAAISSIHNDLKLMAVAYQEALHALEVKRLYDLDEVVYYSEIATVTRAGYHYSYEMEQELIRAIQMNNSQRAIAVFEQVVSDNVHNDNIVPHEIIRCLVFDLLGTVMKAFDGEKESQTFIKQLKPAKRLSECRDLPSMKNVFRDILKKCCEYFKPSSNKEQHTALCAKIQEYIKENYWDTNLSVTSIANHFSMSPIEMSKMFREVTEIKICSILSEVRIREAKKQLLSSNANLSEIADKVGFGSTKTFTRMFKQVEGYTPGQWRESQKLAVDGGC